MLAESPRVCYNTARMIQTALPAHTHRLPWLPVLLCILLAAWGLGWSALRIATEGVGVLGVNNAVPWGWDIVLFVFWIGLGHAGTLISAILLLSGKHWRCSIARHAELMTLCAVCTAAVFPLVHVGRAWMLWQMAPLPLPGSVWPELASALVWDAAAISSYLLLSILFFCMGIRGEHTQQAQHRRIWAHSCLLMAGILTPLVVMVHSIVGSDFALTLRWQSVIIPPYFVCGALLSGMAAVQLIALCTGCRIGVIAKMAQLTAALGGAMGLFYGYELLTEPSLWGCTYATMLLFNTVLPTAVLSIRKMRYNRLAVGAISLGILWGMWQERVHIIIERSVKLTHGAYSPSTVDMAMAAGSIGLFLALFIFIKSKLPQESLDPRRYLTTPPPATPRRAALIGSSILVLTALLWAACTQWADTAGATGSSPQGLLYYIPALLVIGLLGAGLGVFINYIKNTRKS